jgi:pimeloyl-ACP methyl ester carboxylesterase
MSSRAERFTISIPDAVLADLKDRLARTRYAPDFANDGWAYGTEAGYLRELVDYWRQDFDWRRVEADINRYAHYRTTVDGVPLHFIHERGKGPKPMPLVLSHGWPWTFWDFNKIIGPLSDPAAHGGDPVDAFDVVIPSLPGYTFSSPLRTTGINFWRTADLWAELMRDVLGYPRFAAEGGDWGALVTEQLGHKYADRLFGIYLHFMAPNAAFLTDGNGYLQEQATRPQTLAQALHDSPAGLASWLVEKRRAWSDCGGDVERRFTKDDLCTTLTLYWATETFHTSARYYYEAAHNLWQPAHDRTPIVEAPTGIASFPGEVFMMPKRWAERYFNLKHWQVMPSGGHFAPFEEPERFVADLRAYFRAFR